MIANRPNGSNFRLLCHFERIIDLNTEIAHCTFQLCVTEQKLYRPQIFRSAINQSRFSSSHRVGAIGGWIEAYHLDPAIHYTSVLTR